MSCVLEIDDIITLVINSGGTLSNLVAIACLLTNRQIEQSLRAILLSFSISNVIGSGMFIADVLTYICEGDEHPLDYIVIMTMVLSLSHVMLLLLHYYILLTSSRREKAADFSGLILTAWITSAALGSMINVSTRHQAGHVIVVALFMVLVALIVRSYFFILTKHKRKEAIQVSYKRTYLYLQPHKDVDNVYEQWNLNILAVVMFANMSCSIPWLTNELLEFDKTTGKLAHAVSLCLYAINFYVPSFVSVYMRYKEFRMLKKFRPRPYCLEESYRLRKAYASH